MNNLKLLLKQPIQLQRIPKWIPVIIILLTLIGFADSTYLTVKHFEGVIPPCSIGGCEKVLSSSYSEIFGIPVSLLGSLYYFMILLSLFLYFDIKNSFVKDICLKVMFAMSAIGFIGSVAFIFIMLFIINSICIYCMTSDIISIVIFILASHILYLGLIKKHE